MQMWTEETTTRRVLTKEASKLEDRICCGVYPATIVTMLVCQMFHPFGWMLGVMSLGVWVIVAINVVQAYLPGRFETWFVWFMRVLGVLLIVLLLAPLFFPPVRRRVPSGPEAGVRYEAYGPTNPSGPTPRRLEDPTKGSIAGQ